MRKPLVFPFYVLVSIEILTFVKKKKYAGGLRTDNLYSIVLPLNKNSLINFLWAQRCDHLHDSLNQNKCDF